MMTNKLKRIHDADTTVISMIDNLLIATLSLLTQFDQYHQEPILAALIITKKPSQIHS